MDAGVYDITISPRGSFRRHFEFMQADGVTPLDFTNCEARMEVRPRPESETLYISINEVPSASGEVSIGVTPGVIDVFITATATEVLKNVRGAYWDLFVEFPNAQDVEKFMKGKVRIDASVTEPSHD